MDIVDFLPKYPNIENTEYDVLNPYQDGFNSAIYHKKEFYDLRLERVEGFPKEPGILMRYQETVVRFLSNHTPYDRLLLVHSMGVGKTCSAIGAIEHIRRNTNIFLGAVIIAKEGLLNNFVTELSDKCTSGDYRPKKYRHISDKLRLIRKTAKFYNVRKENTYHKFAKMLSGLTDRDIVNDFSNRIIVIDEVHTLQDSEEKEEGVDVYGQFHRFLHLIKNSKVLFLSGTPMKDRPDEIASICNLFLPLNKQLPTEKEFLEKYMILENGIYRVNPAESDGFKRLLTGYISFLREPESLVKKEFIGRTAFGLSDLVVYPVDMSVFQTEHYSKAFRQDTVEGKGSYYSNSREASLFVYPDGSYGQAGFSKYIITQESKREEEKGSYRLSSDMKNELMGETRRETLDKIGKYSATYKLLLQEILETKGNCFIYSSLVNGSGSILFSLLLELFGFTRATGNERTPGLRYAIITNTTTTDMAKQKLTVRFNSSDNRDGDYIKVILGSKVVSEGYSFNNVVLEAIATPHWNYSETSQALARGLRLGSHRELENPVVRIVQPVAIPVVGPGSPIKSIDLLRYKSSERKDIAIRGLLRLLMETAVDCALNYNRNRIRNGRDGSPECDYTTCEYVCDGIDRQELMEGIPSDQLDLSTYHLYYVDPVLSPIYEKVDRLFRENKVISRSFILKRLSNEFSEDNVMSALRGLFETGDSYDYRTFTRLYANTPVRRVINCLEEVLFSTRFEVRFEELADLFPDRFVLLSSLQKIINENLTVRNRYGISCYLRERENVYFLVDSLACQSSPYSAYYVENPYLPLRIEFSAIVEGLKQDAVPNLLDVLAESKTQEEFNELVKTLTTELQERLIEASIVAKDKDIITPLRDYVLAYYKGYITQVDDVWISTFQRPELRCVRRNGEISEWAVCPERIVARLEAVSQEKEQKIRENPYGIMGKYNPTLKEKNFCLVDLAKEKRGETDKRKVQAGKVCDAGGWKVDELLEIIVKRLRIPIPTEFRVFDTPEAMLREIRRDPKLERLVAPSPSRDELRSLLYWGTKEAGMKSGKTLCEAIQGFLREKGLVVDDYQCGLQGKRKKGGVEEEKTEETKEVKKRFRIEQFVPAELPKPLLESYTKEIQKLMEECFNVKKYKLSETMRWMLIFSKKKTVGMLAVDKESRIWNVCIGKNYRRKGIAREAIGEAVKTICERDGKQPSLIVDNSEKDSEVKIRIYTGFGFVVERSDREYTYMTYACGAHK